MKIDSTENVYLRQLLRMPHEEKQASTSSLGQYPQDSVFISNSARARYADTIGQKVELSTDPQSNTGTSSSTIAGATGQALHRYLNIGSGSGSYSLMARNTSRKSIGSRINTILKGSGIRLSESEKLAISVDSKNTITVGGIKDKKKAKAIEEALNADKSLGRDLRKHTASSKITSYAKRQNAYEERMQAYGISPTALGEDTNDSFTNRGMRAFIIEEYLQEKAGIGLSDLSLENGADGTVAIRGMNDALQNLVTEDPLLRDTIVDILENGDTVDFEASFEYANGAISDAATLNEAHDKVEAIRKSLMGGLARLAAELSGPTSMPGGESEVEAEWSDQYLRALRNGFSIQVTAGGKMDIVVPEDLDARSRDILLSILQKVLDDYDPGYFGQADSNWDSGFADVAQVYLEQHRFEHGDIDDHEHMVKIDLTNRPSTPMVVSPEADKALDQANQELAGQLGEQLREMLEDNGIDTEGLELTIDGDGKITVTGDPGNANVEPARTMLAMFSQSAKAAGLPDRESEEERRAILTGEERQVEDSRTVATPDAWLAAKAEEEFRSEKVEKIRPFLPNPDFDALPVPEYPSSLVVGFYLGVQGNLPKDDTGLHFLGTAPAVSRVGKPRYAVPETLDGENAEATALYLELVNGMGQFHDGHRGTTYSL